MIHVIGGRIDCDWTFSGQIQRDVTSRLRSLLHGIVSDWVEPSPSRTTYRFNRVVSGSSSVSVFSGAASVRSSNT